MGSVQSRPRRLESAISICLVSILFLIGLGVFLKQFDYDISQFGMDIVTAPKFETPFDLSSLATTGFEALSEIEMYNPENLYEKIDGKAPFYTESGFEKLSTRRFASKDDESLGMELYLFDMGSAKNAFSVYSVQKRAGAEDLPAFAFAYRTSNALFFVHGKYYIELVGFSESDELFKAMMEISRNLRGELNVDEDTRIAELDLFPRENIIPGSIKLYLASAFGFEGLTDTFTAKYQIDDETVTAFLSKRATSTEALKVFLEYHKFLLNNGGVDIPTTNPQARLVDFYGTIEYVFAAGPFVAGIHEAKSQQLAEKLAVILVNKLDEAAKAARND